MINLRESGDFMLGKGTYCYIKPVNFSEDNGGFETVINLINSSRNLVLINTNGEDHLGFMVDPEDNKQELYGNVYPFIFIHDEENKKFYDAVTNTPYSYRTYDNDPTSRAFLKDNGELGDYIEDATKATAELSKINVSEYVIQNIGKNTKAYKNALLELERVIKEGYKLYYQGPGKPERGSRR